MNPQKMSQRSSLESYDLVPYVNKPHPQSHPDRLATVATLLGLNPPPIDRCRVLELGCARGGNVIPMAQGLPGSWFLGVDHSPRQIADGQRVVAATGLRNIELRTASILDVDDSYGQFDYIISHGVYSWVPAQVRDKLLDVYRRHLAPEGLGYISYNALPGWHLRGMIRDMMLYHIGRFEGEPLESRIGHARALLDFLARAVPGDQNLYGLLLRQELEVLKKNADAYFVHDHLEVDNDAFYFFQFEGHLKANGLCYLGEANMSDMRAFGFPPEVRQTLAQLAPGQIELEQYLDFLHNRTFRQTLVCHEEQRPTYVLHPERIAGLHLTSAFQPAAANPDLAENVPVEFVGPKGDKTATKEPIAKAAMLCLAEAWPQAIAFDDLCRQARARLNAPGKDARQDALTLRGAFLSSYASNSAGIVELHVRPLPLVSTVSERPTASALARWQAAHEPPPEHITNLRHERLDVADLARKLLPLLDGKRDRADLLEELVRHFRDGEFQIVFEGQAVTAEATARELLGKELEQHLRGIARAALLVA